LFLNEALSADKCSGIFSSQFQGLRDQDSKSWKIVRKIAKDFPYLADN